MEGVARNYLGSGWPPKSSAARTPRGSVVREPKAPRGSWTRRASARSTSLPKTAINERDAIYTGASLWLGTRGLSWSDQCQALGFQRFDVGHMVISRCGCSKNCSAVCIAVVALGTTTFDMLSRFPVAF